MKAINIMNYLSEGTQYTHNNGIRFELVYAAAAGEKAHSFDKVPYYAGSDVNVGNRHISVKSSKFTLMSGSLCEGETTFDGIWNLYERKVHSNEWAYITAEGKAYEMNLSEFKQFVYEFCSVEKESSKNGGKAKIRCRRETKAMLQWLEARA